MNKSSQRWLGAVVLAFILPTCAHQDTDTTAQPQAFEIDLKIEEEILENGLKVLMVERHDAPRVFCALFFKVGSVNERPGITGVSHMLEHMLFKGTRTLGTNDADKDAQFNREIDRRMLEVREIDIKLDHFQRTDGTPPEELKSRRAALVREAGELARQQQAITVKEDLWTRYQVHGGVGLNASTWFDSTQYFVELPTNKVELFFWQEADRMREPVFREFYAERDVVKEERRMRIENSPTGLVNESFRAMFWGGHPYHWPVIGWMSDLNLMRMEDAEQYFRTYYSPRNAVAVFVGDLQPEQIRTMARRYFAPLKNAPSMPAPVFIPPPAPPAERRMAAEVDAPSSITIQFHAVQDGHPDIYALAVLEEVLNGRSGRLYRHLVEGRKVALEASANAWDQKYGGGFTLSAKPREGVGLNDLEKALMAEVDAILKESVTPEELEKGKNKLLVGHINQVRSIRSLAFQLGYSEVNTTWKDLPDRPRLIQSVTAPQVQDAAGKYLKTDRAYILHLKRRTKAK